MHNNTSLTAASTSHMLTPWRGMDRGVTDHTGRKRLQQFSSGSFFDADRMGYGALRVLDDEWLAPGAMLDSERRANMEILTWVLDGQVDLLVGDATDSLGRNGFACVSAGSGIDCAMRNSGALPAHVVQLWLQPTVVNAVPRSKVRRYIDAELRGGFRRVAASADAGADIELRADVKVAFARAEAGEQLCYPLPARRRAWLQVLRGNVNCGDFEACAGDGIAVGDASIIELNVRDDAEIMLVELT